MDLLTGRKNLFEPLVSKESLVNLETAEKQPEDLKELYQSGAILNDLDNSKKSSEDSGDQEDLDGSESFNSLAILVTPIEQQAIDDYIATALPIGNRNYIKEGFYGNARDDLRRFFANPLGLPITSGTTPDGIMFEFVRLSDGSTITARSSSKSTGDPTMDVTYRTGLQLKVRYVGF